MPPIRLEPARSKRPQLPAANSLQMPHALLTGANAPVLRWHSDVEWADIDVDVPFSSFVPPLSEQQRREIVSADLRPAWRGERTVLQKRPDGFRLHIENTKGAAWYTSAPIVDLVTGSGERFTVTLFAPDIAVDDRGIEALQLPETIDAYRQMLGVDDQVIAQLNEKLANPREYLCHVQHRRETEAAELRLRDELSEQRAPVLRAFQAAPVTARQVLTDLQTQGILDEHVMQRARAAPDVSKAVEVLEASGVLDFVLGASAKRLGVHVPGYVETANTLYQLEEYDLPTALRDEREALNNEIKSLSQRLVFARQCATRDAASLEDAERRLREVADRKPYPQHTAHFPYVRNEGPSPLHVATPKTGGTVFTGDLQISPARYEHARESLRAWASAAGIQPLPGEVELPSLAMLLLGRRVTDKTEEGQLALTALQDLGVLGAFNRDVLDALSKAVGNNALAGTRVVYHGHALQEMAALKPTFDVLGASSGNAAFSPASGTEAMNELFRMQLEASGEVVRLGLGVDHRRDVEAAEIASLELIDRVATGAEEDGEIAVVDKGGIVAKYLSKSLDRQIRQGTLRFIAHNADDLPKLQNIAEAGVVVDLSGSRIKHREADIIGDQFVLVGAREARLRWAGAKLRDLPLYVVGFGIIGGGIGEAITRLGLPPKNVTVIDPSPEARRHAEALGYTALAQLPPIEDRPPRAVVYMATTGPFLNATTVHAFADDVIFLSASSGGTAVDVPSLESTYARLERRPRRRGPADNPPVLREDGKGDIGTVTHFSDWDFETKPGPDGRKTRALVPIEGFPIDLYEEQWSDRFGLIASAILIATIEARRHSGPPADGSRFYALPDDLQDLVLQLYEKHGLNQVRPLAPMTEAPAERAALEQDLRDLRGE